MGGVPLPDALAQAYGGHSPDVSELCLPQPETVPLSTLGCSKSGREKMGRGWMVLLGRCWMLVSVKPTVHAFLSRELSFIQLIFQNLVCRSVVCSSCDAGVGGSVS